MFGKDKKTNYTVIVLGVLLVLAIIYIAYGQYTAHQNTKMAQAYQQGFIDAQENTLLAVVNEVATKGFIQITDFKSNASVVLVPYQPPTEEQVQKTK